MLGRRLLVAVLLLNALLAPLSAPARASDIDAGPGFRRDELTASDVEAGLRGQRLRGLIAAQSRDAIDAALHPFTVPDGPANCVVQRCVALTFDDGPSANSEHLLDVLAGLEVKATFFVIGRSIGGRSATLQRMQREGHEIGNHT
ncbi:MAG: polysaccharide deacetylase family protein, partial [Thermoflexales bacterium]|nr:polysaccharide deacetylase family protein [Thermoflexales bacterium]